MVLMQCTVASFCDKITTLFNRINLIYNIGAYVGIL